MRISIPGAILLAAVFAGAAISRAELAGDWAFKTGAKPEPPNAVWPERARNVIDHFIQARLDKEGLSPSPRADARTLVRRLYFDLHGLPPAPEQLKAGVEQVESGGFMELAEELLNSPRYGERWARHWLDVAHYGETHGYDKDKPRPNAWPYRDYVVQSFNSDKSYSRFMQEQIAADALFPTQPELIPALGFLAAGPWDFVGHVELPESKMDGLMARYNDRDDMLMTTFSSFMSLTVHCARCHDHKMDPISARDYYKLQAVFAGTDRADREFEPNPQIARRRKQLLLQQDELKASLARLQEEIEKHKTPEVFALEQEIGAAKRLLDSKESPANGYHSEIEKQPDKTKWVQVDLGESLAIDSILLAPARPTDFRDTPGFGFPHRFKVEVSDSPTFDKAQVVFDGLSADVPPPGDHAIEIRNPAQARIVRVTATRLWERSNDYVFALAELQVWAGGRNVAAGKTVTALDSIEAGRWSTKFLVDNFSSRGPLISTEDREELQTKFSRLTHQLETLIPADLRDKKALLSEGLAKTEEDLKALPPPSRVYAAANRFPETGHFKPATQPRAVHYLRRGELKNAGEPMSPGSLEVFADLTFQIEGNSDEARRAALARWLCDPKNLQARRSFVNRVWQYHFGRGLVDTPNDFGQMGSRPTHPELLDWLAHWFLENGESPKKLHRLILESHTWQQSSQQNPGAAAKDQDNRLLWRMNRQRLDAESVRDSVLAISGELDLKMGGPSVQHFEFKDDHSPIYDYAAFDSDNGDAARRSIYRFIVRSVPDPFMDSLDCADPSLLVPKRNTTQTALQALSMLNNTFVVRQAEKFAERLSRERGSLDAQIQRAFELALGRLPENKEAERLMRYASEFGLASACRLILNLNEFLFVD